MKREALKEAYSKAVDATVELERARNLLSELHYRLEEVENSKFLLNNIGKWADPSDDAHEVLFERVKKAESDLNNLLDGNVVPAIKASIARAEKLCFEAGTKAVDA